MGGVGEQRRRWSVRLKGEAFDLEDLVELVTSPTLRVVKSGAEFILESATFESLEETVPVLAEAQRLLPLLNGIGKLKRTAFRDVDVDGCVYEHPSDGDERRQHAIVQMETLQVRVRFPQRSVLIDGQPAGPGPGESETDRWLALAALDADVGDALHMWSGSHDWVNLYRVFEIIEGRADIVASGWASRNEAERFARTANHPDAVGADARHARSSVQPPPKPMTLEEAAAFIRRNLTAWLESLSAAQTTGPADGPRS